MLLRVERSFFVAVHNLSDDVIFLFLIGLAQLVTIHSIIHLMYYGVTHTSGLNSHIREKRLSLSLSCSRIPQSKFHIPLITPSVEFSTENQPIQKHTNSWKKVESTGSHALTVI